MTPLEAFIVVTGLLASAIVSIGTATLIRAIRRVNAYGRAKGEVVVGIKNLRDLVEADTSIEVLQDADTTTRELVESFRQDHGGEIHVDDGISTSVTLRPSAEKHQALWDEYWELHLIVVARTEQL